MTRIINLTGSFCQGKTLGKARSANPTFGAGGGIVEVDETYIGRDKSKPVRVGYEHKFKVLSLLHRATGRTRMMHVEKVTMAALTPILQANIAAEAH